MKMDPRRRTKRREHARGMTPGQTNSNRIFIKEKKKKKKKNDNDNDNNNMIITRK